MTMLAPSAAARSAIALPMPRLAPVMNRVFPARFAMGASYTVLLAHDPQLTRARHWENCDAANFLEPLDQLPRDRELLPFFPALPLAVRAEQGIPLRAGGVVPQPVDGSA